MRKVLYIASTTKFYSGAELSLFNLMLHLREQFDVRFLVPDRGELFVRCREARILTIVVQYIPTGIRALSFPRIFSYILVNTLYIFRLTFHILRNGIDIVHVNEIYNFPALIAARIAGARTVCHVRAGVLPSRVLRRIAFGTVNLLAGRTIWVSRGVRDVWHGGATPSRESTVIHNMHPDSKKFDPAQYPEVDRKHLVVGMVSKFNVQKGHGNLIEAAARIREMDADDIRYSIVGGPMKGHEDFYDHIIGLIRSRGLESEFALHGMSRDVPRLLSEMDVFVHPPDCDDAFPTVVLEAMMMEKPVVCFDRGGISEQFENGVSGILVPAGNIDRLAREIASLCRDPARRRSMGKKAREHVLERFSPEALSRRMADVYTGLFAN